VIPASLLFADARMTIGMIETYASRRCIRIREDNGLLQEAMAAYAP